MNENKNTKPTIFLILKIVGLIILGIGIILLISSLTKKVPSMGSNGWFEASKNRSSGIFGGVVCLMIGGIILFYAFIPAIQKTAIKTKKYIIKENQDDLKDIASTGADIASDAITKTVKSVKAGIEEEQKFCKHCGEKIDADSIFCPKCGKEQ